MLTHKPVVNIIVLLSLMTYSTTLYVSDSLQKDITRPHYKTPAGVAVKETINFSDEHIVPTPPSGPKNTSHEMPPPHPPCPPGAVGSERALIVSLSHSTLYT